MCVCVYLLEPRSSREENMLSAGEEDKRRGEEYGPDRVRPGEKERGEYTHTHTHTHSFSSYLISIHFPAPC